MISKADMEKLTDAMAIAMVDFIKPRFQGLERRIEALESDRQAKGVGPPSPGLPAARPRVRVPATVRAI